MFGLPPSPASDPAPSDPSHRPPGATELARDAAACHKRSNILLALTQQDLAEAKESLERCVEEEIRRLSQPTARD